MAWKSGTIMSQKIAFIQAIKKGQKSFKQNCQDFGISRQTGYKTLHRYQELGEEGLIDRSRAPLFIPHKTPPEMEERIVKLRIKYPTWGARKIHAYFKTNLEISPSIGVISDILKRNGYIKREESLKRKKLIRFEREKSNELWQMDFKGKFKLETAQWCFPLTILDDYSRFSLGLKSCANEKTQTVFKHLNAIFSEYGLPNQINVDNGNPWGGSSLTTHTTLTIWLMRLGIKVTHSRPRHPQTNGKIERFHRTLKQDVLSKNEIKNFEHAQELFDAWRCIYNNERPHEAIGMITPSKRYEVSKKQMPEKLPFVEYDEGAIVRKVRGNGGLIFKNKEFIIGKAFRNLPIQIIENEAMKTIEAYFGNNKVFICALA